MPPSLSRSSLSSLGRCRPSYLPSRNFSTTISLLAIGPESPRYIEIPYTPQRDAISKKDIKGKLPPPRNLFPKRGRDKTSPDYFAQTIPEPKAAHRFSKPADESVAFKRRMAASRRANLREGLAELHRRKVRQERAVEFRSAAKREDREERVRAPQRDDELFTNPTIKSAVRALQTGFIPDPEREAIITEKAARVEALEAIKSEQRKDALQTLYMNARSFITTEEQLDTEIEKIFIPYPQVAGMDSIWDALAPPPTVQDMLSVVNHSQSTAMGYYQGPAALTGKRMKRIAEELTGGKMDG